TFIWSSPDVNRRLSSGLLDFSCRVLSNETPQPRIIRITRAMPTKIRNLRIGFLGLKKQFSYASCKTSGVESIFTFSKRNCYEFRLVAFLGSNSVVSSCHCLTLDLSEQQGQQ